MLEFYGREGYGLPLLEPLDSVFLRVQVFEGGSPRLYDFKTNNPRCARYVSLSSLRSPTPENFGIYVDNTVVTLLYYMYIVRGKIRFLGDVLDDKNRVTIFPNHLSKNSLQLFLLISNIKKIMNFIFE